TLKAFAKMLLTYGRGRAEQFRLHPTLGSVLNFVPPVFSLYLVALPFLGPLGLAILGLYFVCVSVQVAALIVSTRNLPASLCAGPLVALSHVLYGLGFWRGLFTPLKTHQQRPHTPVDLEKLAK